MNLIRTRAEGKGLYKISDSAGNEIEEVRDAHGVVETGCNSIMPRENKTKVPERREYLRRRRLGTVIDCSFC
jgi:hypothetical protein